MKKYVYVIPSGKVFSSKMKAYQYIAPLIKKATSKDSDPLPYKAELNRFGGETLFYANGFFIEQRPIY